MTAESSKIVSRTSIHELKMGMDSTSSLGSDFENLLQKNWSAFWHLMAQRERNQEKSHSDVRLSKSENETLRKKIKKKIQDLMSEEETLLELYMKAAKAAKERQEELGDKIAILLEQIEKDRVFLKELDEV